jgi:hypothetical protein
VEGSKKPAKADDTVNTLEKDLFYYRNANKELKTKLREVVAVNHKLAKSLEVKDGSQMATAVERS